MSKYTFLQTGTRKGSSRMRLFALPGQTFPNGDPVDPSLNVAADRTIRNSWPEGTIFATTRLGFQANYYKAANLMPVRTPDGNSPARCRSDARTELEAFLGNEAETRENAANETAAVLARELPNRIVEVRMKDGSFHYITLLWDAMKKHVPENSRETARKSLDEIISRLAKQDSTAMPTFDLESHRWKAVNVREIEEILPEGI